MIRKLLAIGAVAFSLSALGLSGVEARGFGGFHGGFGGFHGGGFHGFGGWHGGFGGWRGGYWRGGYWGGRGYGWGWGYGLAAGALLAAPYYGYGYPDYGDGGYCYYQRQWVWNGHRYAWAVVPICQ